MNWFQEHWAFLTFASGGICLYLGFWIGDWSKKRPPRQRITITGSNGKTCIAEIVEGDLYG